MIIANAIQTFTEPQSDMLERTEDILAWLGANKKPGQFICGFSMETENLIENSKAKLEKKNVDMIVANTLLEVPDEVMDYFPYNAG